MINHDVDLAKSFAEATNDDDDDDDDLDDGDDDDDNDADNEDDDDDDDDDDLLLHADTIGCWLVGYLNITTCTSSIQID